METGLKFTSKAIVGSASSAEAMGSGDLPVFATPSMVALMENAAMNAVAPFLPEGATTVGAEINTTHVKPTPVGTCVEATATLVAVEGRKLSFEVEAVDNAGLIGKGTHVRFVVDRERFMAKLG